MVGESVVIWYLQMIQHIGNRRKKLQSLVKKFGKVYNRRKWKVMRCSRQRFWRCWFSSEWCETGIGGKVLLFGCEHWCRWFHGGRDDPSDGRTRWEEFKKDIYVCGSKNGNVWRNCITNCFVWLQGMSVQCEVKEND